MALMIFAIFTALICVLFVNLELTNMLISIDWIKDFTKLPDLEAKAIGERFTLGTAEVEDIQTSGLYWQQIKVASVLKTEPHPEADKLQLATIDVGDGVERRVVCGAHNCRAGIKTPYAPVGVTLPGGLTLEPKKIRGVLSEGMLCSEEELGTKESSEGILELPEATPVGMTMAKYFDETSDVILDVDNKSLTHRPDLWGHYGIAREFSALFETPLSNPYDEVWQSDLESKFDSNSDTPLKPQVAPDSAGLAYWGLAIDGVEVTESPRWLQRRLQAVGLRPINNIVDASNYVMLELGIPNHVFDREKIAGNLVIEKLQAPQKFITLDEVERDLEVGDTVIRDDHKTLVLAGIMGGLNSGVSETTTKVFLEVANWHASSVRRTSTRLGLRTDSSQRYEKTLDSSLCYRTLLRLTQVILELCPKAKIIGVPAYDGLDLTEREPLLIETSYEKIIKVLGHEISNERVLNIFSALGFKVERSGGALIVNVPSWRATKDIECEADLIEEIGRVVGYDHISPIAPALEVTPVRLNPTQVMHRKIKDFMSLHANAHEVMTYPLIGEELLKRAGMDKLDAKVLINALSKDHDRMRPSLVPSLLEACAKNAKNSESFNLFEIGRVYLDSKDGFCEEHNQLIVASFDRNTTPFMRVSNTAERLLSFLQLPADMGPRHPKFSNLVVDENWHGVHPYEFTNIKIMGRPFGAVFSLHPLVLRQFKIKGHLSFFILDMHAFETKPIKDRTSYHPLPKFPSSEFDFTLDLAQDTPVGDVLAALSKIKIKELVSTKVLDIFKPNDKARKYITFRSTFLDPQATLTGEFLKSAEANIISSMEKAGYPLRS
jgi:phenylalanyl-tRNA synthetase beta chain